MKSGISLTKVCLVSLALAVMAGTVYFVPRLSGSVPLATDYGLGVLLNAAQNDSEETFPVPVPAVWLVDVVGVLESGQAYAFERIDNPDAPMVYGYFERMPDKPLAGFGTVRGLWQGTTCAYRNTVFGGACVPEVLIRGFESLGDEFPE